MSQSEGKTSESFEQQLTYVFELHEQGRYEDAESLYQKLIEQYPSIWQLHFNYGLLLFELSRFSDAERTYRQGLSISPDNVDLWYNLALCCKKLDSYKSAVDAYENALSVSPDDVDCLYNLAGCYREMGEDDAAIHGYEKTLKVDEAHLSALNNLAYLHHKNGNTRQAAELYRKILSIEPDHERADHMLASIEGEARENAPDSYIRDVFDNFSDHYENSLIGKLEYRIPSILLQFMKHSHAGTSFGRVLDLGCGTGLAGEVLRPFSDTLTGIDISEKMVAVAQRKSIYNELHVSEIMTFLSDSQSAGYDCIVAADVFPYIGELGDLFNELARVVDKRGSFVFSVESLLDDETPFKLLPSGRFAHTIRYIESIAAKTGWKILNGDNIDLRKEKNAWIDGIIFYLKK